MTDASGQTPKVCALFMFNHRFEKVLPLLDRIYGERFTHRHVLMPFAKQPGPGMSRIYELGRNFSGHIAQGARDFMRDDFTHYVIIPDDLLLHPSINENNILEKLGLDFDEAYINNIIAADALRWTWEHSGDAAASFERFAKTIDLKGILPPADEAKKRFEAMGITFPQPGPSGIVNRLKAHRQLLRQSLWCYFSAATLRGKAAPYPLLSGYSDFFVVPAGAMEAFVQYCAVFSALNIFAEVAVPTALALATDRIHTELQLNSHFRDADAKPSDPAALRGVAFWEGLEASPYAPLLAKGLDEIMAGFPDDVLYFHPIKLSQYL